MSFFEDCELKTKKELGDFKSYKEVLDFFPRSVWEINSRSKEIKRIFEDDLEKHTCERTENGIPISIHQKLSVFNPNLGINILKIWSNVGDNVIDPFSGRDRALITNYMDRNYTGYEISPNTFNQLKEKVAKWKYINNNFDIELFNDDGTLLNQSKDSQFDFCYSCPPYWFKEKYESVKGQLSDCDEFEWKKAIDTLAINLHKKLKMGAYCVFVIADIRHDKKLIPLHCDFIQSFLTYGFSLKDIVINKTNPMQVSGINGFLRNKITLKSHEYVLVFKNEKI